MNFISPSFKKVLWPVLFIIPFSASFSASIKTYFNQNPKNSYTDPYRHINRPGDDLEKVIIEHVLSAKKSILIAVQELRLPLVAQALMSKRAQGLDIRVVLEHDYNNTVLRQKDREVNEHDASKLRDLIALVDINRNGLFEKSELESRDAVYMLMNAQIPLMDDTADGTAGSGLMHHKFIIIDGKKTIISTANFTPSCIHGDITNPSTRGNANSMMVIESVGVAKVFTDEFSQLWGNGRRGNFGQRKTYRGPQTISVSGTKITIQFSPTSRNFSWEESVNGLIGKHLKSATDSVHAALFVFSDQKLSQTLEEASAQGAHLGFIIEPWIYYYRNLGFNFHNNIIIRCDYWSTK
jgi:phosphatidylserine/phosphatidylglycerophosphate/cardiolipin synthase-like enzyme